MEDDTYTIGELADRAGVSVRTIRFYIEEGLLPPPRVQGRNTTYDAEYLIRLELIRRLKDAFLPLQQIRQQMDGLPIEKVRELLVSYRAGKEPPAASEQADEVHRAVFQNSATDSSAAAYIARILDAHSENRSQAPQSRPHPGQSLQAPDIGRSTNQPSPAEAPAGSTWRRVLLAPGVELHFRQPLPAGTADAVEQIIAFARRLFGPRTV